MVAANATLKFANNVESSLAADITANQSTFAVAAGQGALFPSLGANEYFVVTLMDPVAGFYEICNVTARSGDTFTVERGAEGTTPRAYMAEDTIVQMRITAGVLNKFVQKTS